MELRVASILEFGERYGIGTQWLGPGSDGATRLLSTFATDLQRHRLHVVRISWTRTMAECYRTEMLRKLRMAAVAGLQVHEERIHGRLRFSRKRLNKRHSRNQCLLFLLGIQQQSRYTDYGPYNVTFEARRQPRKVHHLTKGIRPDALCHYLGTRQRATPRRLPRASLVRRPLQVAAVEGKRYVLDRLSKFESKTMWW